MPHTAPVCPQCGLENTYSDGGDFICPDCAFEWSQEAAASDDDAAGGGTVKDANGNPLAEGDSITLIKDLKLGGAQVLKAGAKAKNIRLQDGDHEIACKVDGVAVALKACFVKKA